MSLPSNKTTRANAKLLRKNMTDAEKKLWQHIRAQQLGIKFRRQVPIGGYVVDFYAYSVQLAIELDGSQHYEPLAKQYDALRTDYLHSLGITVIRYDNLSVLTHVESVLMDIANTIQTMTSTDEN